jgi:hypothetical protein
LDAAIGGLSHPPDDISEQGIADISGAQRWSELGDDPIAIGHEYRLAIGRDTDVFAEFVLQALMPTARIPNGSYR